MKLQEIAGARLDVRKYLAYYEIGVHRVRTIDDGRTAYSLARCPFDASHKAGDAAIFQDDNGKLSAKCFHDSCSGRGWAEFRNVIGPILPKEHLIGGKAPAMTTRRTADHDFGGARVSASYDLEVMTNAELWDDETQLRFLVDEILVAATMRDRRR